MSTGPFLYVDRSQGSSNDPFSPFDRQLRRDVHCNAPAPHRPHPMALSMASPVQWQSQMQDIAHQLPGQQPSKDSLRAALPRPQHKKPVTDEDFRWYLADLGAPGGKVYLHEPGVGRPRECELAAPRQKDYAPEHFERAQRYYKKYHNAWRNFHSTRSKLETASCQEKGRLQKRTLKYAELLKTTKESYLCFSRTGIPLRNRTNPEQKQKRLDTLRGNLEKSHKNISKTQESLARGEITEEEAAASLQRQNHWKSWTEGEIADIEYGIQHEDISPNEGQSTAGNANAGNVPPAHAGSLSQEGFRSDYPPSSSSGSSAYEMGETSYVSHVPEQHFITSGTSPFHSHQLAPRNTEIGNTLHAKSGPPSGGADSLFETTDHKVLAGNSWIGGVPDTPRCPRLPSISDLMFGKYD